MYIFCCVVTVTAVANDNDLSTKIWLEKMWMKNAIAAVFYFQDDYFTAKLQIIIIEWPLRLISMFLFKRFDGLSAWNNTHTHFRQLLDQRFIFYFIN